MLSIKLCVKIRYNIYITIYSQSTDWTVCESIEEGHIKIWNETQKLKSAKSTSAVIGYIFRSIFVYKIKKHNIFFLN